MRTYKYRLYPNRAQTKLLERMLEIHRTVYNDAMHERREAWGRCHVFVTFAMQSAQIKETRTLDAELAFLNFSSVQRTLRRLDKTFCAFFRRLRRGETLGYPRFKGKNRFNVLEYTYNDGCRLRKVDGKQRLYIQNVGELRIKYHRPIPSDAKEKCLVVLRKRDKWYVCIQTELPSSAPIKHMGADVGIDVGLTHLLALSDGTIIENPRWFRTSLREMRIAQRRMARRKTGSVRWRRAAWQAANLHERIANRRNDFWHKMTQSLVTHHKLIAIEDMPLGFMLANRHLGPSTCDAGLGMFRRMLQYKAEEAGTTIIAVNPSNTSQACSGCGAIVPKDLSVRVHQCHECGLVLDRDVNAAVNILAKARMEPSWHKVDGYIMLATSSHEKQK